jgi:hypothetical protein
MRKSDKTRWADFSVKTNLVKYGGLLKGSYDNQSQNYCTDKIHYHTVQKRRMHEFLANLGSIQNRHWEWGLLKLSSLTIGRIKL